MGSMVVSTAALEQDSSPEEWRLRRGLLGTAKAALARREAARTLVNILKVC